MEQVKMYQETMAAFKARPEMPKTQVISEPLPQTPAKGTEPPQIALRNVDVFQLMSELTGKIGVMNFASPVDPGGGKKPLPRGLIWFQPLSSTWQIIMSLIVASQIAGFLVRS